MVTQTYSGPCCAVECARNCASWPAWAPVGRWFTLLCGVVSCWRFVGFGCLTWLNLQRLKLDLLVKLAGCCHKTAANFPHGIRVRGIRDRGSCSQGSASNRSVRPLHCVMHMHTSKLGSGGREKILRRELEQLRRQRAVVVVVVGGEGGGDAIPPMQRTCVVPQ